MPRRQPSRKKKTPRLQKRPKMPRAKTKPAIKRREKTVSRHIEQLYGRVYCPALRANVAFNRRTSSKEARAHSAGDRDSALFAVNIEQLLQTATVVDRLPTKPGNKSQAPFCEMVVLEQKIKRHGTAKITIGKYKPDYKDTAASYCHYCVTRWNLRKR